MAGSVLVVNKHKYKGQFIYIGRGSVFGNRHPVSMGRIECIKAFKQDLREDIALGGPMFKELAVLIRRVAAGESVALGCFCKPQACHGDILKEYIDYAVILLRGLVDADNINR